METHDHAHSLNRFAVIPAADRLNVDPRFTGRGVTIAFLDSGFYRHPDLVEPNNRIVAFHDIQHLGPEKLWKEIKADHIAYSAEESRCWEFNAHLHWAGIGCVTV